RSAVTRQSAAAWPGSCWSIRFACWCGAPAPPQGDTVGLDLRRTVLAAGGRSGGLGGAALALGDRQVAAEGSGGTTDQSYRVARWVAQPVREVVELRRETPRASRRAQPNGASSRWRGGHC